MNCILIMLIKIKGWGFKNKCKTSGGLKLIPAPQRSNMERVYLSRKCRDLSKGGPCTCEVGSQSLSRKYTEMDKEIVPCLPAACTSPPASHYPAVPSISATPLPPNRLACTPNLTGVPPVGCHWGAKEENLRERWQGQTTLHRVPHLLAISELEFRWQRVDREIPINMWAWFGKWGLNFSEKKKKTQKKQLSLIWLGLTVGLPMPVRLCSSRISTENIHMANTNRQVAL